MLRILNLVIAFAACFLALVNASSTGGGSPKAGSASYSCTPHEKALRPALAKQVRNPAAFCEWWTLATRHSSPWPALPLAKLNGLCKCIDSHPALAPKTSLPAPKPLPLMPKATMADIAAAKVRNHVSKPLAFCRFWLQSSHRKTSPFHNMAVSGIYLGCKKVVGEAGQSSYQSSTTSTKSIYSGTSTGAASSTTTSSEVNSTSASSATGTTSSSGMSIATTNGPTVGPTTTSSATTSGNPSSSSSGTQTPTATPTPTHV